MIHTSALDVECSRCQQFDEHMVSAEICNFGFVIGRELGDGRIGTEGVTSLIAKTFVGLANELLERSAFEQLPRLTATIDVLKPGCARLTRRDEPIGNMQNLHAMRTEKYPGALSPFARKNLVR